MADDSRNRVSANFLERQFQNHPKSILDVACGDGRLSVQLAKVFPFSDVTGVDPKPRGNKQKIRFLRGLFPDRVKISEYDLIVGMHPDGATWPIVIECCRHRIPFAVVPCCLVHVPPSFPGGNMHVWVKYIVDYSNSHDMRITHTILDMYGANEVVLGIPNEKVGEKVRPSGNSPSRRRRNAKSTINYQS